MKFNRSWLMVLCVVGMGSVFVLPALGIPLGSLGGLLLVLLCPLSHVLMMWGLFKKRETQDAGPATLETISSGTRKALSAGERTTREG